MSFLKRVGRNRRRLNKQVDEMEPAKLYTLTVGGKRMTRNGATWKKIKAAA